MSGLKSTSCTAAASSQQSPHKTTVQDKFSLDAACSIRHLDELQLSAVVAAQSSSFSLQFPGMDAGNEVEIELFNMVHIYRSGHVERITLTDDVPAGVDPVSGVASKDVVIDPAIGVSARLFLPDLSATPAAKLPVLVYYHGGGFCIESAFSPRYTNCLNSLTAQARIVAVSVQYRLAPEHPLPAAYDDAVAALRWVVSHAGGNGEEWLSRHGDFSHLFVAGDSAGANIAHHVVMDSGGGGRIKGMALIHPFFWAAEPVGEETRDVELREKSDRFWRLVCPGTAVSDDPRINPLAEGAPPLRGLGCARVMVEVAGEDKLRDRGRAHYEALRGSGWEGEAEMVVAEEEVHVFHLEDPASEKAKALMQRLVDFLSRE